MANAGLENFNVNWDRSILIQDPIDDDLLKKIAPRILQLRQVSDAPITVGLDSPGGSVATLDTLLALLLGPTQDKKRGRIITVVTNRAYSAAASFLAFGTYSVALPKAKILYHDIRYGGIEDVTPSKAKDAADALQYANDELAMRLAPNVIRRLIWVYIDLSDTFDETQKLWPKRYERFSNIVNMFAPPDKDKHSIKLASFATSLYSKVSRANDELITTVMEQLGNWIGMTRLIGDAPIYRAKGGRKPGLLDGAKDLNKALVGKAASKSFVELEPHLKLLVGLMATRLAGTEFREGVDISTLIEQVLRDLKLIESMDDPKHQRSANELMLEHDFLFFGRKVKEELKGKSEDEKEAILAVAAPHARLLWCFCVLLCRELFKGEHHLTPRDAQLLGLVNEVAGGGAIESHREWRLRKIKEEEAAAGKPAPKKVP
jgi:ATP-dependent protease ClpP protease subunit